MVISKNKIRRFPLLPFPILLLSPLPLLPFSHPPSFPPPTLHALFLSARQIRRCKYCVNPSDSLLTLIKDISPDINWLRLWAANGNDDNDDRTLTVTDPDMLALSSQQQVVNVGPGQQGGVQLAAAAAVVVVRREIS